MSAAVVWGVLLTAITEILSLFNLFSFPWALGAWLSCTFIAFFILHREKKWFAAFNFNFPCLLRLLLDMPLSLVLIVPSVGLIALIAPPNNWDSMTYHMGRVVHWIQNHNVAFYPTVNLRQLYQPPWAEFAIAHFQLLSQTDRLANLVQWFSMLGSLIGVTLIARRLGAAKNGQILAAIFTVSLPMGILQASSTQNDYVATFWLVCFVYYLLNLRNRQDWVTIFGAGAGLGLVLLTKATAYVFAVPFIIYLVLAAIKTQNSKLWKAIFLLPLFVILLNAGHYGRNLDLYGYALGPGEGSAAAANAEFSGKVLISNLLRNLSMHFGTPFKVVNEPIERVVQQVHTILGIDVNDPRSTWSGVTFRLSRIPLHEDWSGNPVHLILFTFILSVTGATIWRNKELLAYLWSVGGAFLLFCAYLKWQPWHSRLHLPLFVLFCPLCAVLLDGLAKPKLVKFSVNLLLAAALPFVFLNISRPILFPANIFNISRKDLYFSNRPYLRNSYIEAVNFISGQNCSQIGLYIGGEDWEYPFWMLLEEKFGKSVRLEHIGVGNYSTPKAHIAPFDAFCPCAIISTRPEAGNEITFHAGIFEKKFSSGTVSVFVQR